MILTTSYLPPISWFAPLVKGEPICIEQWENFHKQTIRNRCRIDSPNGPLNLTIPIDKENFGAGGKCLMKDVKISYHLDWQHQHWNALETSYFNSPFFEYLQDDFRPFYERKWNYLMDFNEALILKCCELMDIEPKFSRTEEFLINTQKEVASNDSQLITPEYYQVFGHKHGFLPNLSIIDLIFNLGTESVLYLQKLR